MFTQINSMYSIIFGKRFFTWLSLYRIQCIAVLLTKKLSGYQVKNKVIIGGMQSLQRRWLQWWFSKNYWKCLLWFSPVRVSHDFKAFAIFVATFHWKQPFPQFASRIEPIIILDILETVIVIYVNTTFSIDNNQRIYQFDQFRIQFPTGRNDCFPVPEFRPM